MEPQHPKTIEIIQETPELIAATDHTAETQAPAPTYTDAPLPGAASQRLRKVFPDAYTEPEETSIRERSQRVSTAINVASALALILVVIAVCTGLPLDHLGASPIEVCIVLPVLLLAELAWLVVLALLWHWLMAASKNIRSAGYKGQSPVWMLAWAVVPIAHLWLPYILMEKLFVASKPTSMDSPLQKAATSGAVLYPWWSCWIASILLPVLAGFVRGGFGASLPEGPLRETVGIASGVLLITSMLMLKRVVQEITHMQEHKFGDKPSGMR